MTLHLLAPADPEAWRSRLLVSMVPQGPGKWTQVVQKTSPNVTTILRYHSAWAGAVAYDSFAEQVVFTRPPPWLEEDTHDEAVAGPWAEADGARLVGWLARAERLQVKVGTVLEGVLVAAESQRRHPVRTYLRDAQARWDCVQRLPTWLETYCGAAPSTYASEVGKRWMISAVARILRPGCQVDCMLVLEGRKGMGKSSAFRALVPDARWQSETGITIGDKDSYQNLHGVWIYVFDELGSTRKADVTRVKNFITSPKDRYRPSFARLVRDFPRQNVFGGTTDEDDYFAEPDRRYWPSRVLRPIDMAAIVRDRDQLWGEAMVRFESGERWHVDDPELQRLCEEEQNGRVISDAWEPIVAAWLERPTQRVGDRHDGAKIPLALPGGAPTVTEVLLHAIGKEAAQLHGGDERKAANVLTALGYTRGPRVSEHGARVRRYLPPAPATKSML